MRCLKLPYRFDPERLRADLAQVAPGEWIPHINRAHYDGEWSGAALRSIGGAATNLIPDSSDIAAFQDTALLARCAYFRAVLGQFHCPIQAARLLRLHAGSNIAEHVDRAMDFEDGEVRLHVPIVTSDQVHFYLDGSRLVMAPGDCWYTNVNLPHSVQNGGASDRIHLVIDCRVNDWLREVFARPPQSEQEGYAAVLRSASPPPLAQLFAAFSALAVRKGQARSPIFQSEGCTLVLAWPGQRTWQLRLALPRETGAASGADWTARLESSPDAAGEHSADFLALLDELRAALPGLEIASAAITSTPSAQATPQAEN